MALARQDVETLPWSQDAEQGVLGSVLIDSSVITEVMTKVKAEHFFLPLHQKIYAAMLQCVEAGEPADIIPVFNRVGPALAEHGGPGYLASLVSATPVSVHAGYYARIVAEQAIRRGYIDAGTALTRLGYDTTLSRDTLRTQALTMIDSVDTLTEDSGYVAIGRPVETFIDSLNELMAHRGQVTGIPTGFIDIDRHTTGMQRSEMTILGALSSVGKTAFALNVARHVGVELKRAVGIHSIEMGQEMVTHRLLSLISGVDSQRLRTGRVSERDSEALMRAAGQLYEAPIYVDDASSTTPALIWGLARRLKERAGLELLIVDYLQIVDPNERSHNRVTDVGSIARGIRRIARDLNIHVLALAQLNDLAEHEVPALNHLRESREIGQTADAVILLHRVKDDPSVIRAKIAKNRNGPRDVTVDLYWDGPRMLFGDLERRFAEVV